MARAWGQVASDAPAPQGLSIVLADRNYTVSGAEPLVHLRVKAGPLHLQLDIAVSSSYNLTLIWNKHMTISIKVSRATQVPHAPPRPWGAGPARAPADPGLHRTPCAACAATTTGT